MGAVSDPSDVRQADPPLATLVARVVAGEDMAALDSQAAFSYIMEGRATSVQIAAFLVALQSKGCVPTEVAGGVRAMREAMIEVSALSPGVLVDTCGTGGGSVSTFNISTAAALVAAGGGVQIAKHGNRSFTSRCGSADVLEALGVQVMLSPRGMADVLRQAGIVFMFAPLLHPAMRHVAPVRRELGIATVMNVLGPLTNPAGARRQVVGVADPAVIDLVVCALAELGHERALVVHGAPGMDEVSPCDESQVHELRGGKLLRYQITPEEMGVERVDTDALAGGGPEENAAVIRAVLRGDERGAPRAAVLVNAAAAFLVADQVTSLREGVTEATNVLDSGAAAAKLDELVQASQKAEKSLA